MKLIDIKELIFILKRNNKTNREKGANVFFPFYYFKDYLRNFKRSKFSEGFKYPIRAAVIVHVRHVCANQNIVNLM